MRMFRTRWVWPVVSLILCTSWAVPVQAAPPEPGPENGGLRLRFVVTTDRQNNVDRHEVALELLNVTKEPIRVLADWPYEEDEGGFQEYVEQAVNLKTVPEIGPWEGQIMSPNRNSPQPEHVLAPDTPLMVKWSTTGRNLKNKENPTLDMSTQPLPTDGLYSVRAVVTIRTTKGTLTLESNEQKVPVGGSREMPKHPLGRTIRINADTLRASIDLGSPEKIAHGDQFILRTGMGDFWRLTIDRVGPKESEGQLVPSDWSGRDAPAAKPPLPTPGTLARLLAEKDSHQPPDPAR